MKNGLWKYFKNTPFQQISFGDVLAHISMVENIGGYTWISRMNDENTEVEALAIVATGNTAKQFHTYVTKEDTYLWHNKAEVKGASLSDTIKDALEYVKSGDSDPAKKQALIYNLSQALLNHK
jgi:NAD-dependent oxidoreductase involved in siderophore biosynthesis